MTKPVTIDNLGIDSSRRYAQDVTQTDTEFFQDSGRVSQQTSVLATSPRISEFDELFGTLIRVPSWASFSPPPNFTSHARNLFSYQLIPSLGAQSELDTCIELVENYQDDSSRGEVKRQTDQEQSRQDNNQEANEEESDKKKILSMLQSVQRLDRILELINSRKGEFQKG